MARDGGPAGHRVAAGAVDDQAVLAFFNPRADGLQALRWWKEGKMDEIAAYCRMDDMEAVVEAVWRWSGLNDE